MNETGTISRVLFRQGSNDVEVFQSSFVFATSVEPSCINISAIVKVSKQDGNFKT